MQDKKSIIGLVVAFIALMLYMYVVLPILSPKQEPRPRPGPEKTTRQTEPGPKKEPQKEPEPEKKKPAPEEPPKEPAEPDKEPAEPEPDQPHLIPPLPEQPLEDNIRCETAMFVVTLTNEGAAIRDIRFNREYYTYPSKDEKLKLITEIEDGIPSLTMRHVRDLGGLDEVKWEHLTKGRDPEARPIVERFRARVPELGLEVTKTYRLYEPGAKNEEGEVEPGRDIKVDIAIENLGPKTAGFKYLFRSAAGIVPEPQGPRRYREEPGRSHEQRDLERSESRDVDAIVGQIQEGQPDLDTYDADDEYEAEIAPVYAGVKNRYFAGVLKPVENRGEIIDVYFHKIGPHNVTADLEMATVELPHGESVTKNYLFFVGPRKPDAVAPYARHGFEALIHYGWPSPVTRFLSWLLKAFHSILPNYGWSILLLTVCVRLALHPLTVKSQKSAHKMQKIQPLIKEAKEKHKDDKQRQQQEMMKIMREQGASPLGGCLPLLLQLPIFIGLFQTLRYHPELRHAPFILWINDLATPDHLITFTGWSIPLVGWRSLNLLPILCAAAMILQQQMTPKSDDPQARQQQKVMMFMPLFLLFVLYTA
ncbi:MAG: YidC/Oxa1 family insertase periplasmic-domain containing protein, partial [Planctomycetota bacterium]